MHDSTARTEHRLSRFVSERLAPHQYRATARVTITAWEVPDEPVPFSQAVTQTFTPFKVGQAWSKPWGTTWFHVTGTVPAAWAAEAGTRPELVVDLGYVGSGPGFQAEAAAYRADGTMIKAVEPRNMYVTLDTAPGEPFELFVEAAANPTIPNPDWITPTSMGDKATAGTDPLYTLRALHVGLLDTEVWELTQDVWTLQGLMHVLPKTSTRRHQILAAIEDMLDAVDPFDLAGSAAHGRAALADVLASPAPERSHTVHAMGHAHIDSAWLWPVRETVRKCARTFANVIALMDDDPDVTFACSSAQQYDWVKQHYPELFERIKAKVAEGRFVPTGGMWVESDTNMPGGEALARQFVTGTSFFIDEFGFEPTDVWLPDSFGYTAAMPQIATASGKTSFLTQKISWNDTNTFPHHTFWWEGIDGTRIFTHFPPSDTYNAEISAAELHRSETQFAEKGRANVAMMAFGFGDGGGGPTREMMAAARRTASLEGSPRVTLSTPQRFFDTAKADHERLATWTGEMYLEYHRGTYTSQHLTKAGNRRSEHLLREAELWWTTAAVREGASYPREALDRLWKLVLLQQFHDILPGSSIAWVHREAERNYQAIEAELEQLVAEALGCCAGSGRKKLAANARPQAVGGLAGLGIGPFRAATSASVQKKGKGWVLSSAGLQVVVNSHGLVTSLFDLDAGRELLPGGELLGRLQLHRDIPNEWDAWDINEFYRRHVVNLDDVSQAEEVDGGLRFTRSTGPSTIVETLTLTDEGLRFVFDIDWHDRQQLLKLDLPFDLHARDAASEIQFGHLYRPTAVNTSWDAARFETIAHRWLHVGEPGYGVALANSCTYGYDVTRTVRPEGGTTTRVRPSLLRAPLFPDPEADQGQHHLEFLLVPGAEIADAIEAGYAMNLPLRSLSGGKAVEPLVVVDDDTGAVVVEAVKLAEDGSGDVVVRLYEALGGRASALVTPGFKARSVQATDLLERAVDSDAVAAGKGASAQLSLRPFQIVTLRFAR